MSESTCKSLCVFHILDGLRDGLSHFSGASRAAVLYAEKPSDPLRVYDPQNLLQGHEPKIRELYLAGEGWRGNPEDAALKISGHIHPEKNLDLSGLISCGGRTFSIFYQMWFTEHHPDMCSIGPTERWLEHAAYLLSHYFANEDVFYTGMGRYILQEYATHAVRDYIRDSMNFQFGWDTHLEIYPILDAVQGISRTPEEGAWPRGKLVFVEPDVLSRVDFLVRFPSSARPRLKNFKHVRKLLLAVEDSTRKLVCDGKDVVGIGQGRMPECRITAEFRGGYGFLELSGKPVCSFAHGRFHSSTRRPNLVQLEEALLESRADSSTSHLLFRIVAEIVQDASESKHGCSLILDLNDTPVEISGQRLEKPVDLQRECMLELAKSLSKVDGALQIGADLHLHGFACLLDGRAVKGEDRARGARFNSALRFTAEHENIIVVVVSSDRPVSVMRGGIELTAVCEWKPFSEFASSPPTLEDWLVRDESPAVIHP